MLDDLDKDNLCTECDIHGIRLRAQYLSCAYRFAIQNMTKWSWQQCCQAAIDSYNKLSGVAFVKNAETIMEWNMVLRASESACFANPARMRAGRKPDLPPLLENNPDLKEGLLSYCKTHLDTLSAESVASYLFQTGLPQLVEQRRHELDNPAFDVQQLLHENGLNRICISTIYKWMERLGFRYETRKKCYYVDGHEATETQQYRKRFIEWYL